MLPDGSFQSRAQKAEQEGHESEVKLIVAGSFESLQYRNTAVFAGSSQESLNVLLH